MKKTLAWVLIAAAVLFAQPPSPAEGGSATQAEDVAFMRSSKYYENRDDGVLAGQLQISVENRSKEPQRLADFAVSRGDKPEVMSSAFDVSEWALYPPVLAAGERGYIIYTFSTKSITKEQFEDGGYLARFEPAEKPLGTLLSVEDVSLSHWDDADDTPITLQAYVANNTGAPLEGLAVVVVLMSSQHENFSAAEPFALDYLTVPSGSAVGLMLNLSLINYPGTPEELNALFDLTRVLVYSLAEAEGAK